MWTSARQAYPNTPPTHTLQKHESKDELFRRACSVTSEWENKAGHPRFVNRIQQRRFTEKSVPLTWRTLAECLDPQPRALVVIKALLEYIDRCDAASMTGAPRPPFCTPDGHPIFPEDERWWMTELSIRKAEQASARGDEDGPPAEAEEEEDKGADSDVIDPELPIEEDDSSGDDVPASGGDPVPVRTGHDAQLWAVEKENAFVRPRGLSCICPDLAWIALHWARKLVPRPQLRMRCPCCDGGVIRLAVPMRWRRSFIPAHSAAAHTPPGGTWLRTSSASIVAPPESRFVNIVD